MNHAERNIAAENTLRVGIETGPNRRGDRPHRRDRADAEGQADHKHPEALDTAPHLSQRQAKRGRHHDVIAEVAPLTMRPSARLI